MSAAPRGLVDSDLQDSQLGASHCAAAFVADRRHVVGEGDMQPAEGGHA